MTSHVADTLHDAWKALDAKNYADAEHLFKGVIQMEADERMNMIDIVDAHNGLGEVSLAHCDLLDARRWFHESKYLLDRYYHDAWPTKLSWKDWEQRVALRTLLGMGHVARIAGDGHKAKEYYERVLKLDPKDGGGAKQALEDLALGKVC